MQQMRLQVIRKNPLSFPMIMAKERGLFAKQGIEMKLNLKEDFIWDGHRSFYSGESDGMMGDFTDFFYLLEQGKEAVMTSTLTPTFAIIGKANLAENLQGLKIGGHPAGLLKFFLEKELKAILPGAKPIWFRELDEGIMALEHGKIDALAINEPFVSQLALKGYSTLWHSRASKHLFTMWAFDAYYYEKYTDTIKAFHRAVEEAMQQFNQLTPKEKINVCEEEAGYESTLAEQMATFIFDKQQPVELMAFKCCEEWMYEHKEIFHHYSGRRLIKNSLD